MQRAAYGGPTQGGAPTSRQRRDRAPATAAEATGRRNRAWQCAALAYAAALIAACGSRVEPGPNCAAPAGPVGYADQVKSVLDAHCAGCHSATTANRFGATGGLNFDTYAAARSNGEMGSQDALSGRMPPSAPLNTEQACLIYHWVQGGYLP